MLGQCAYFEIVVADLADGRDFRCRAGQPALLERLKLGWHDVAFVDFDAFFLEHPDHSLAGDAVQEGVWQGGVNLAVFDEEDVGAGRFGT